MSGLFALCCAVPKVTLLINDLTAPSGSELDKRKLQTLVQLVNTDPKENGKHAAKTLLTKLDDWSTVTQLRALMLLEVMMKECSLTFFDSLAARNVPQHLSTLAIRYGTNEDVKVKAEELLQEFAMTVLLDDTVSEGLDPLIGSGKTARGAVGSTGRTPSAAFGTAAGTGRAAKAKQDGQGKSWTVVDKADVTFY